jgi:hypothetical protein
MDHSQAERIAQALEGIELALTAMVFTDEGRGLNSELVSREEDARMHLAREAVRRNRERRR